jgi:restriction system protein
VSRRRRSSAPRRRGRRGRKKSDSTGLVAVSLLVAVTPAVAVVQAFVRWITDHWWAPVIVVSIVVAVVTVVVLQRVKSSRARRERLARLRLTMDQIDRMKPVQFELACSDLMERDGLTARQRGGANDEAADVIARTPTGQTVVVQCKHTVTGRNVEVNVLYAVNGTARPVHGADIVIVATNGGFTRDSWRWGPRHDIHLLDREKLRRWAEDGLSLHEVLGLPPFVPERLSPRLRPSLGT